MRNHKYLFGAARLHAAALPMLVATGSAVMAQGMPPGEPPGGGTGGGTGGSGSYSGTYAATLSFATGTHSLAAVSLSSVIDDVGVVWARDRAVVSIANSVISQNNTSSDRVDSSQYGLNSSILAAAGGTVSLVNNTVTSIGDGANSLFATGSGSSITMTRGSIYTDGDGAHGIDVTYGGSITLNQVNVTTTNSHSSAIATDFGGGTVAVNGGRILTYGTQSAGIYSADDVTVSGAAVTSYADNGAVIDADGKIALGDTALTGRLNGVMIWRTIPDGSVAGVFTATGSTITGETGDALYVNGANAQFRLDGVALSAGSGQLLNAVTDSSVTAFFSNMSLAGSIVADSTSTLSLTLTDSFLAGVVTNAALTLVGDSLWSLTGNSLLTTFSYESLSQIAFNGYSITLGDGTVLSAVPEPGSFTLLLASLGVVALHGPRTCPAARSA